MSVEDDIKELTKNQRIQAESFQSLMNIAKVQATTITALVANMQAMGAISHGLMASLHADPKFIAGVKYGIEHRDALFNGSTMTDAQIEAFKTDLRNLLHPSLRHLLD